MLFPSPPFTWYPFIISKSLDKWQKNINYSEQTVNCLWSNGNWRKTAFSRYVRALACTCASSCSHIPLLWNSDLKLCPHFHSSYSFHPHFSRLPKNEFTTLEWRRWMELLGFPKLSEFIKCFWTEVLSLIKCTPAPRYFSYLKPIKSMAQWLNSWQWDTYRNFVNSFQTERSDPAPPLHAK